MKNLALVSLLTLTSAPAFAYSVFCESKDGSFDSRFVFGHGGLVNAQIYLKDKMYTVSTTDHATSDGIYENSDSRFEMAFTLDEYSDRSPVVEISAKPTDDPEADWRGVASIFEEGLETYIGITCK